MKRIKLHLNAGQQLLLGQMLSTLPGERMHCTPALLLERLVLLEWLAKNARRFVFATDKPLRLTPAEALSLNRVMRCCSWPVQGAGAVATEIIRQLDPGMPGMQTAEHGQREHGRLSML